MAVRETVVEATGVSLADLEAMPEDLVRRDLIDDDLYVSPSPVPRHQEVVLRLARALSEHADVHGGRVFVAPLEVVFSNARVLQPDVCYVAPEHEDRIGPKRVEGPPDLVAEVSSPSTRSHDLVRKRAVYEQGGVPAFWFVDLEAQRVEVYTLASGRSYRRPAVHRRGDILVADMPLGFSGAVDDLLGA